MKAKFAVVTDDGMATNVWSCWSSSNSEKEDVYLTSDALGKVAKLSLHESGAWHVAFYSEKFEELFDDGNAPEDRFLSKYTGARPGSKQFILAARVQFPWFSPNRIATLDPSVVTIAAAAPPRCVEIAICIL